MTEPDEQPHCDHPWIRHKPDGTQMSVDICEACGKIDGPDLERQLAKIEHDSEQAVYASFCRKLGHRVIWTPIRFDPETFPGVDQAVAWYQCAQCGQLCRIVEEPPQSDSRSDAILRARWQQCMRPLGEGHKPIDVSPVDAGRYWFNHRQIQICTDCGAVVAFYSRPDQFEVRDGAAHMKAEGCNG